MIKRILATAFLTCLAFPLCAAAADSPFQASGRQILDNIQQHFWVPDRSQYLLEIHTPAKPHPCWIWDASIQLQALCAAARMEPRVYLPMVERYATSLAAYRTMNHGRPGFDVNPPPKTPDRYYDDNGWIACAFLEAYQLTHDRRYLALALDAYNFTLSGEDDKLGGGIYWHEDRTDTKNACSSGPAMVAAMMLYKISGEKAYVGTTVRLYDWTRTHLQDEQGLVLDHINLADGKATGGTASYNTGTLITTACLLFQATSDKKYLEEAERVGHAAEKRFIHSDGSLPGWGKLNVKLIEGFLKLNEIDHDPHWLQIVGKCLVIEHGRQNSEGWYALDWGAPPLDLKEPVRLIDQSAPARAYWIAAEHGVVVNSPPASSP